MQASRMANAIIITLALLFGLATAAVAADEAIFKKTKQVVQEGDKSKEKDVALVFSEDENVVIRHRKKEEEVYATIPYSAITGLTYERSTHARAKTGHSHLANGSVLEGQEALVDDRVQSRRQR